MRVDVRAPLGDGAPALVAGVHAALLGGFGSLALAGNGSGRPAVALRGVRQWGRTNIKFDIADHGGLTGPSLPSAVNDLAREFGISTETRVAFGRRSLPLPRGWQHSVDRGGNSLDRVDASLALALGEWRFAHGLSLEKEGSRFEEVAAVPLAGREDGLPALVLNSNLHPALNHIERARGIVVAHFIRHQHDANGQCRARRYRGRSLDSDLYNRAFTPLLLDLRDLDLAL